jgi:periplasmic divalent cation tolerance protein
MTDQNHETVAVVLCTAPADAASDLAERLVTERLAACVNLVGPVHSKFWWEGRVDTAEEILLVAKTPRSRVPTLIDRLAAWHPYDVPEILELPVERGLESYLDWVRSSSGGP